MTRTNKFKIWILIFTILYILIFGAYYLISKNFEFMIYVLVLILLTALVIVLDKLFNFSTGVLFGTSLWGLMHMAGGSIYINGIKLYALILIPLTSAEKTGTQILRYDQFLHFYCYVFLTLIAFHILKHSLSENRNKLIVSVMVFFIGMGIGGLNEIIELSATLLSSSTGVGDYFNNAWDLVFNGLGALTSVLYLNIKKKI